MYYTMQVKEKITLKYFSIFYTPTCVWVSKLNKLSFFSWKNNSYLIEIIEFLFRKKKPRVLKFHVNV